MIYIGIILKGCKNMSQKLEICAYCSLNKQYMKGVHKWSKMVIAMYLC